MTTKEQAFINKLKNAHEHSSLGLDERPKMDANTDCDDLQKPGQTWMTFLESLLWVSDLGCGAGDVSFLAAQFVGPTGSVVGIDRSREVLGLAAERAQAAGLRK
jgi:SAM-dependent methyltransferase